jgi:hypothetical protein
VHCNSAYALNVTADKNPLKQIQICCEVNYITDTILHSDKFLIFHLYFIKHRSHLKMFQITAVDLN